MDLKDEVVHTTMSYNRHLGTQRTRHINTASGNNNGNKRHKDIHIVFMLVSWLVRVECCNLFGFPALCYTIYCHHSFLTSFKKYWYLYSLGEFWIVLCYFLFGNVLLLVTFITFYFIVYRVVILLIVTLYYNWYYMRHDVYDVILHGEVMIYVLDYEHFTRS